MDFLRLFIKLQKQKEKDNFQLAGVSPCRQTHKLALVRCRGVRRIVHCLNMLLRVQAPDEQYLATVQHGSLLRAKFQFSKILVKSYK